VVAHSLANLCRARYAREALNALRHWLYEPSPSPLAARARTVFDRLMRLRVEDPDGSLGVPVLLHLSMEHAESGDAMRSLWYGLLVSGRSELEEAARRVLHDWLVLTDDDEHCHDALWALLDPLLKHPMTRRRTRNALRRHAFETERGSQIANQLLNATRRPPDIVLDWAWRAWQRCRSWRHQHWE
jgi:hypothetical protein